MVRLKALVEGAAASPTHLGARRDGLTVYGVTTASRAEGQLPIRCTLQGAASRPDQAPEKVICLLSHSRGCGAEDILSSTDAQPVRSP